jgi:hypothetical protein
MDVAAWLQDLGLERYVPAFRGTLTVRWPD